MDRIAKQLRALGVPVPGAALLKSALSHRSFSKNNYERLEFLGDALVNLLCAELLFKQEAGAEEGQLTRMRAALVDEASLAQYARELNLGDALFLGAGELKSGGHRRESILADAYEALCAAVYLEHGISGLAKLVEPALRTRLPQVSLVASLKDPKTRLQEWLQGRDLLLPNYFVVEHSGAEHDRKFVVRCQLLGDPRSAFGTGSSRRRAEQAAAGALLLELDPL